MVVSGTRAAIFADAYLRNIGTRFAARFRAQTGPKRYGGTTRRWPRRSTCVGGRPGSRPAGSSQATVRCCSAGAGRLPHRLGQGDQVVGARRRRLELALVPDQVPAARGGQAAGVRLAQVVGVRLGERGQGADHGGRVGIDIGQCGDGRFGQPLREQRRGDLTEVCLPSRRRRVSPSRATNVSPGLPAGATARRVDDHRPRDGMIGYTARRGRDTRGEQFTALRWRA